MMTFICDYAKVSPAVLELMVSNINPHLFCQWWDESEDTFTFRLFSFDAWAIPKADWDRAIALVKPALYIA